MPRKTLAALIVLLVIAIVVGMISPKQAAKNTVTEEIQGPYQVTVVGKLVCLPHKDTSGPTTLECMFGLQTEDGKYYAVSTEGSGVDVSMLPFNEDMLVMGMYSPLELLSTDQWNVYNIEGIIAVTDIVPITEEEAL